MDIYLKALALIMKHSGKLPIIISCLALLLGGINFYYTFLKNRKALHVVYVGKIGNAMLTEFAIVNGGKKDLLMTNLTCSFGNTKNNGSSFTPAQRIEFKESDSYLLPAGKGFYCKTVFTEKFTSSFAKSGKPETYNGKLLYMHDMYVDISWVEMDGVHHNKSVKLMKYGFNETGEIRRRAPSKEPINLYKQ